jgi:superfamily II DNA or RNA helicase
MQPGDKVFVKAHPGRIGILGNETDGPPSRLRYLVSFLDGTEDFFLLGALDKVEAKPKGPYDLIKAGRYARAADLRGAITYFRLSGKLANLIYSLNTTNTRFLAYQFKPVLQFLDSPSNGLLIADEVGLGKTIEAGLIWTELRARQDARRLLVVCPAMLREKWRLELMNRFGVQAEIVDAGGLLERLTQAKERPQDGFALIASMQGIRPPARSRDRETPSQSPTAKLARFLDELEENVEDPLLDLVVIDEAHYLKNEATQTHRLGLLLRPVCLNMVMLSATPIQLRSTDLFNLLHLLDEDAFPYAGTFDYLLRVNEPVVRLRDQLLRSGVEREELMTTLRMLQGQSHFRDNQQLRFLLDQPPSADYLASARGRSELADRLDRLNPLTKVVTRTLKRDVDEGRVVREPTLLQAEMTHAEQEFYTAVTFAVRAHCQRLDVSEGFLMTIPQRQMASCMAAACRGWQRRYEKERDAWSEALYELDADNLTGKGGTAVEADEADGSLISQLVAIARSVGDFKELRRQDSKYSKLLESLRRYWRERSGKKVVLFSFYRHTLYYLQERLAEDGVESVVLHGGMDKQAALDHFASAKGPNILLSSEVASEGVDLQFSSLLVNYDLPWNPAKIEQRIGRIDRIGQQEKKILIWNLVYGNTIDDRVCNRLLNRLKTFERALGSMEALLGEQIRELTYELLSHDLTPEQEQAKIDRASLAIENVSIQQERLEAEATNLLAHGDFIQNKVKAANELGRYIRGEDLLSFIRDFLLRAYPGTRMLEESSSKLLYRIEPSTEARVDFTDFLQIHRLQGRTALLASNPPKFLFENRLGSASAGIERVTQDHPLTRFVAQKLAVSGGAGAYMPVSACQLSSADPSLPPGDYVYVVSRWSFSGSREVERLEYAAKSLKTGKLMDSDRAEHLVNMTALSGQDWLGAATDVDNERAARLQDECRAELEEGFIRFRDAYQREDADRVALMVRTLEHHLARKREKLNERIEKLSSQGSDRQRRAVPMVRGQLRKEEARIDQRIAELRLKARVSAQDNVVSSGVIRLR